MDGNVFDQEWTGMDINGEWTGMRGGMGLLVVEAGSLVGRWQIQPGP